MRLGARIYATTAGVHDAGSALAVRARLGEALAARLADGLLAGYETGSVSSDEQWEDEGMDREVIDAVTGGALPVVYANLTYDADDPRQRDADHGDLIRAFALQPAYEVTPPER
jgi:hypothetical protein